MKILNTIVEAVNRGGVKVLLGEEFFSKKELPVPPKSFYDCFGETVDLEAFEFTSANTDNYIKFLTSKSLPDTHNKRIKISDFITTAILDGFVDLSFIDAFKKIQFWNRTVIKHAPFTKNGCAYYDCGLTVIEDSIHRLITNPAVSRLVRFDDVASRIEATSGMDKIEISPIELKEMSLSYKEGHFFKSYRHLVSEYDTNGYFDDLKLSTPVNTKINTGLLFSKARSIYALNVLADVCDYVESCGGKVALYRPFSLLVLLPKDCIVFYSKVSELFYKIW